MEIVTRVITVLLICLFIASCSKQDADSTNAKIIESDISSSSIADVSTDYLNDLSDDEKSYLRCLLASSYIFTDIRQLDNRDLAYMITYMAQNSYYWKNGFDVITEIIPSEYANMYPAMDSEYLSEAIRNIFRVEFDTSDISYGKMGGYEKNGDEYAFFPPNGRGQYNELFLEHLFKIDDNRYLVYYNTQSVAYMDSPAGEKQYYCAEIMKNNHAKYAFSIIKNYPDGMDPNNETIEHQGMIFHKTGYGFINGVNILIDLPINTYTDIKHNIFTAMPSISENIRRYKPDITGEQKLGRLDVTKDSYSFNNKSNKLFPLNDYYRQDYEYILSNDGELRHDEYYIYSSANENYIVLTELMWDYVSEEDINSTEVYRVINNRNGLYDTWFVFQFYHNLDSIGAREFFNYLIDSIVWESI